MLDDNFNEDTNPIDEKPRKRPSWTLAHTAISNQSSDFTRTLDIINPTPSELGQIEKICLAIQPECIVTKNNSQYHVYRILIKNCNFEKIKKIVSKFEIVA